MLNTQEKVKVRGFARVQLVNVKTKKIEGDSGWIGNIITETGYEDYLCNLLGGLAGSSVASVLAVGSQTDTPASTQTSVSGEFGGRKTATRSVVASQTLRMTANWATNEATQSELGGIGAYHTSTGGTVMNVLTYATSQKTTQQQLNATMEFRF
jgi:hypothetical protein